MPPTVSVIIATYNRCGVLRYAIESVRRNTFQDWEMIVVGDACTDDTAAVVASFQDPRIEFINLAENCGEQSGPNNAGTARARGQFIAYLNHDDMWLPDHLAVLVSEITLRQADLVFGVAVSWRHNRSFGVLGASPNGHYEPHFGVPASLWLFRRELRDEIGPWRYFREIYAVPSQDWLYRAWSARKHLAMVSRITALVIPSGSRMNSYAEAQTDEHREFYDRLTSEPDFRCQLLHQALLQLASEHSRQVIWPHLRLAAKHTFFRLVMALGLSPWAAYGLLRHGRKGGNLAGMRRRRGLPGKK